MNYEVIYRNHTNKIKNGSDDWEIIDITVQYYELANH